MRLTHAPRFFWRCLVALAVVLVLFGGLAGLVLTPVDSTPLAESDHYRTMQSALDTFPLTIRSGAGWQAGWAVSDALPPVPVNLVGQGRRGHYTFIQDTPQIRALTLNQGSKRVAWLNYDVLFVSPLLAQRVRQAAIEAEVPVDHLVFTATHTHSGIGGFADQPLGELVFGSLDEQVMSTLVEQSIAALREACTTEHAVTLSFRRTPTVDLVVNRLVASDPVDPHIRQLILTRPDGTRATLVTFSAHPTILSASFMGVSGDYPRALVNLLEQADYAFALFVPSTPGSHRPLAGGETPQHVAAYAARLAEALRSPQQAALDQEEVSGPVLATAGEAPLTSPGVVTGDERTMMTPLLATGTVPLATRSPHIRISPHWRLRPWVYRLLNGQTKPFFDVIRLGELLMISSSAEISGEFTAAWEAYAESYGLSLMLTTFNGEYMGYITPDVYYDTLQNKNEVGVMNWFGPDNGAYFDRVMRWLIERAAAVRGDTGESLSHHRGNLNQSLLQLDAFSGQLMRARINDPELDARLTLELFQTQLKAFVEKNDSKADLLLAWHWLTTREPHSTGFDAVFRAVRGAHCPTDEQTLSLSDIDIGYAGRYPTDHPIHGVLESLAPGDPLQLVNQGGKWLLQAKNGMTVGRLAAAWMPPRENCPLKARVIAVLVRCRADASEQFQDFIRADTWRFVVPELVIEG